MTKSDLIKALADFDDYVCVIIRDGSNAWANAESIEADGSNIAITMGDHLENREREED